LSFLRNLFIGLTHMFCCLRTSTSLTYSRQFGLATLNFFRKHAHSQQCWRNIISKKAQRIIPHTANDWELLMELEWSLEERKVTKLVSFPTNRLCTTKSSLMATHTHTHTHLYISEYCTKHLDRFLTNLYPRKSK
jgi:hypothetical protein